MDKYIPVTVTGMPIVFSVWGDDAIISLFYKISAVLNCFCYIIGLLFSIFDINDIATDVKIKMS